MNFLQTILLFISIVICLSGCYFVKSKEYDKNNNGMSSYKPLPSNGTPDLSSLTQNCSILPGSSIGYAYLGRNIEETLATLGKPIFDNSHEFQNCKYRVVKWYIEHPSKKGNILEATFSADNRVVQLKIEGPHFTTPEGISNEDTSDIVKENYTDIESYVDMGIQIPFENVEGFPVYWVDKNKGIAFEFYRNRKEKKWRIFSIIVFNTNDEFFPGYCAKDNKYWKKLPPFELKVLQGDKEN
jgi:hypothetical protein